MHDPPDDHVLQDPDTSAEIAAAFRGCLAAAAAARARRAPGPNNGYQDDPDDGGGPAMALF